MIQKRTIALLLVLCTYNPLTAMEDGAAAEAKTACPPTPPRKGFGWAATKTVEPQIVIPKGADQEMHTAAAATQETPSFPAPPTIPLDAPLAATAILSTPPRRTCGAAAGAPPTIPLDAPFTATATPSTPPRRTGGAAATPPQVHRPQCPAKPEPVPSWGYALAHLYQKAFPKECKGLNPRTKFKAATHNQKWVESLPESYIKELALTKVLLSAPLPKAPMPPPPGYTLQQMYGCPTPWNYSVEFTGTQDDLADHFVETYRQHLVLNNNLYGIDQSTARSMEVALEEAKCLSQDMLGQAEKVISGQIKETIFGAVHIFNFLTALCWYTKDEQINGYWRFMLNQVEPYARFFSTDPVHGVWAKNILTHLTRYLPRTLPPSDTERAMTSHKKTRALRD